MSGWRSHVCLATLQSMQHFRIVGLSSAPFEKLFGASDLELSKAGAKRYVVDSIFGFPDRIELRDSLPGETVLLLNYVHQPAETPYRASHAIFVREGATDPYDRIDEIPQAMRDRPLSLRAFDRYDMMIDADLVDGRTSRPLIERFFADERVAYVQAHFAKRGCYAARVERA